MTNLANRSKPNMGNTASLASSPNRTSMMSQFSTSNFEAQIAMKAPVHEEDDDEKLIDVNLDLFSKDREGGSEGKEENSDEEEMRKEGKLYYGLSLNWLASD